MEAIRHRRLIPVCQISRKVGRKFMNKLTCHTIAHFTWNGDVPLASTVPDVLALHRESQIHEKQCGISLEANLSSSDKSACLEMPASSPLIGWYQQYCDYPRNVSRNAFCNACREIFQSPRASLNVCGSFRQTEHFRQQNRVNNHVVFTPPRAASARSTWRTFRRLSDDRKHAFSCLYVNMILSTLKLRHS